MILDQLNLNLIRVFEAVYRTGSMTDAARALHLTQPGVSQHIKSLEELVGAKLFDRVQRRLIATSAARELARSSIEALETIEKGLVLARGERGGLAGTVTLGMPAEFGHNVVLPLVARFALKHPEVRFDLRTGFASSLSAPLVSGEIDFAFVDEFRIDRSLRVERVYDEVLELCASPELTKRAGAQKATREYFESLDYVDYQEDAPVLRKWIAQRLGVAHPRLRLRAVAADVQGVAALIRAGLGAGILPGHLVAKLKREGVKLQLFSNRASKRSPVQNAISLAWLPTRSHSPAALAMMEWFRAELSKAPSAKAGQR